MPTQVFTIVLDRQPTDAELDDLFEAGCGDAMFGIERGVPVGQFDREASTLAEAIVSAVRNVESAGFAAVRVVDEDLLTLADIADRLGQSRESVRRYASGERGPGAFPPPVNPARDGTVFYRWSEVSRWIREKLGQPVLDPDATLVVANLLLQARQFRDRIDHVPTLTQLFAA